MELAADIVGWAGMLTLLFAYARREHLPPRTYALLNLFGALGVAALCIVKHAWPALALETAWAAIALRDLARRAAQP